MTGAEPGIEDMPPCLPELAFHAHQLVVPPDRTQEALQAKETWEASVLAWPEKLRMEKSPSGWEQYSANCRYSRATPVRDGRA